MSNNVEVLVEELAVDGVIGFEKCANSTIYRWTRLINEYLEYYNLDWRVKVNIKERTIEVVSDEEVSC